jgi:hypothetical protein
MVDLPLAGNQLLVLSQNQRSEGLCGKRLQIRKRRY